MLPLSMQLFGLSPGINLRVRAPFSLNLSPSVVMILLLNLGASQSIEDTNGTMTTSNSKLFTINQANANNWLYNINTNSAGTIALGTDSPFLNL